jgi:FMN-dependent NADH-azoreductase
VGGFGAGVGRDPAAGGAEEQGVQRTAPRRSAKRGGLLGGRRLTFTAARGGGYRPGTPRAGWDHREPWLHHVFGQLGIDDVRVIHAELTLSRDSPRMSGLEDLEDKSIADAHAATDELFAANRDVAA